jgi:glutamate synthase (NADPH/NADH) large chain
MRALSRHDDERLSRLIVNLAPYPTSQRAAAIPENGEAYRPRFVKVMPVDYRRAREEMDAAQRLPDDPGGVAEVA